MISFIVFGTEIGTGIIVSELPQLLHSWIDLKMSVHQNCIVLLKPVFCSNY
jgi:hypothetical protein